MASSPTMVGVPTLPDAAPGPYAARMNATPTAGQQWLQTFVEVPEAREWMRVRLELALYDAKERRLNGLIGQYRAFRRLGSATLPEGVCDGYREIGTLLLRAGHPDMSACAAKVAELLESWIAEGVSDGELSSRGEPTNESPRDN
jgi:hypothetical protein